MKLAFAKAEFQNNEAEGFICCSDSPWASPLHMVPKPDGSWQPCSDHIHLTMLPGQILTLSPTFVISQINQRVAQFFSKLDLVNRAGRVNGGTIVLSREQTERSRTFRMPS